MKLLDVSFSHIYPKDRVIPEFPLVYTGEPNADYTHTSEYIMTRYNAARKPKTMFTYCYCTCMSQSVKRELDECRLKLHRVAAELSNNEATYTASVEAMKRLATERGMDAAGMEYIVCIVRFDSTTHTRSLCPY